MARRRETRNSPDPGIADAAALIGDPVRSAILYALLDGRERSASDLANRAGSAANAASAHLAKLVAGGLLLMRPVGRQRLYRLASSDVSTAMEALALVAKPAKIVALTQATAAEHLRGARSCYDHLAGRLGVAITQRLVGRNILIPSGELEYELPAKGARFFTSLGVDVDREREARRSFARQCMDWSERSPHLAGSLGAALRNVFLEKTWVERIPGGRALRVTEAGRSAVRSILALEL